MMKRIILAIIAIFFPWFILIAKDNPGGAVVALIMQATIVGWIPASMWAWRNIFEQPKPENEEKK